MSVSNNQQRQVHVVITIHGIRTYGQWQERLENLCIESGEIDEVINYKFGYFSLFAFVLPPLRWLVTQRFRRWFAAKLQNTKMQRVDLVGHSFGTHVLAWALHSLSKELRPQIHTVILSGSVLSPRFRWDKLMELGVVHRVINDCGNNDFVLVLNQLFVLFTGMAGRVGFIGGTSDRFRNRYFAFGHSGYFDSDSEFMRNWWMPLLVGTGAPAQHDARVPSTMRGALDFTLNNIEPIKLSVYSVLVLAPAITLYWLYRQACDALTEQQRVVAYGHMASGLRDFDTNNLVAGLRRIHHAYEAANNFNVSSRLHVYPNTELSDLSRELLSSLGDELGICLRHAEPVVSGVFSPNGKFVATASQDHSARVWNAETGAPVGKAMQHNHAVVSLAFSPDGRFLATSDSDRAHVWTVSGDRSAGPIHHGGRVTDVAFSPEGNIIATACMDGKSRVWDSRTGALKWELAHGKWVTDVEFSPDGTLVATASLDGYVKIWSTKDGKMTGKLLHDEGVNCLMFSRNGHFLATGDRSGRSRVWSVSESEIHGGPFQQKGEVQALALLANDIGIGLLITAK